jgi:hypothetical protein
MELLYPVRAPGPEIAFGNHRMVTHIVSNHAFHPECPVGDFAVCDRQEAV